MKKIILIIFLIIIIPMLLNLNYLKKKKIVKEEILDNNIKSSVETLLNNFFELDNTQLSEQEFSNKYFNTTCHIFPVYDDNGTSLISIYSDKFYENLKENYKKQNITSNVNIIKIYKLTKDKFEVDFEVIKESIDKETNILTKKQDEYIATIIINDNKYYIYKLYNIKDLENYINKKCKISKYFLDKDSLYEKYIEDEFIIWQNKTR